MSAHVKLDRIGTRAFLRALGVRRYNDTLGTVMFALAARPDRITSNEDLVNLVYGDREDGGPEDAAKNIQIAILRLRRRGAKIRTYWSRGYQLAA